MTAATPGLDPSASAGLLGVLTLAFRHAWDHRGRTALLVGCVAIAVALPVAGRLLVERFEDRLTRRAESVPLIVGARGNQFDLLFAALNFRTTDLPVTPYRLYDRLRDDPNVLAIPIHARFTARREPIVATSFDYFTLRGVTVQPGGRQLTQLGEAVLGADVARRLGLGPGDQLNSDPAALYDISKPSSIRLNVVGVLEPTGADEDGAVFVDIETAWVLEGASHAHQDAEDVADAAGAVDAGEREELLIGRTEDHVALSGAVVPVQTITADNIDEFHLHGSRDELPLTAVLVLPVDEKAAVISEERVNNTEPGHQAIRPALVVRDLMQTVLRVQTLVDAVSAVLGLSTAALLAMIATLSWRVREAEVRTLHEIGAGRSQVWMLLASELLVVLLLALGVSALLVAGSLALPTGGLLAVV